MGRWETSQTEEDRTGTGGHVPSPGQERPIDEVGSMYWESGLAHQEREGPGKPQPVGAKKRNWQGVQAEKKEESTRCI